MMRGKIRIAVSGAGGGTGKSIFCRNLGLFLASLNNRVIIVDFSRPVGSLISLSEVKGWEIIRKGEYLQQKFDTENICILSCPDYPEKLLNFFNHRETEKKYDICICDIPSDFCISFPELFFAGNISVVVVPPWPESILNMLQYLSDLILRYLEKEPGLKENVNEIKRRAGSGEGVSMFPCPMDLFRGHLDEEVEFLAREMLGRIVVGMVFNLVSFKSDMELASQVETFARRILAIPVILVGGLQEDSNVGRSVRDRRGLFGGYLNSPAATDIEKIGRRFLSFPSLKDIARRKQEFPQKNRNHYEVLGVSFTSGSYDIKMNYEGLIQLFGEKNFLTRIITDRSILEEEIKRINDAFGILSDKKSKEKYDMLLFSSGGSRSAIPGEEDNYNMENFSSDFRFYKKPVTSITGSFIKKEREKLGLSLREVASATKIGVDYLRAIEEENYLGLPPEVYVKGYLKDIAAILGLDPDFFSFSYIERMKRIKAGKNE